MSGWTAGSIGAHGRPLGGRLDVGFASCAEDGVPAHRKSSRSSPGKRRTSSQMAVSLELSRDSPNADAGQARDSSDTGRSATLYPQAEGELAVRDLRP